MYYSRIFTIFDRKDNCMMKYKRHNSGTGPTQTLQKLITHVTVFFNQDLRSSCGVLFSYILTLPAYNAFFLICVIYSYVNNVRLLYVPMIHLSFFSNRIHCSHIHLHLHLYLNRGGRWVTTNDLSTSFFRFSPFPTALWDLANSRPVHSLMLSSHLFLFLPCLLPPPPFLTVPCKVLARPDERET